MQGLEDKDIRYSPQIFRRKIARKSRFDPNVDFSSRIIPEAHDVTPRKNFSPEFLIGVDERTSKENLFQKDASTLTNPVFGGVQEATQTDQIDKVCLSVNSSTQTGKEATSSSRPCPVNDAKVQNRGRSTVKIAVSKKKYGLREKKAKILSNENTNRKEKQKKALLKSDQGPYKLCSPEKTKTHKNSSLRSWEDWLETRPRDTPWSRSKSREYLLESLPEPKIGHEGTDSRKYDHLVENYEVSNQSEPVQKAVLIDDAGHIVCPGDSLTSKPVRETCVKKDESTMTNCVFQGVQKNQQRDKSEQCPLIADSSTQTGMKVASSSHPIFQFIPESGRSKLKDEEFKTNYRLAGKRPKRALTERSEKKGKRLKGLQELGYNFHKSHLSKSSNFSKNSYLHSSESWLEKRPRNTPWSRSKSRECLLNLPPQPKSPHDGTCSVESNEMIENGHLADPVEKPGLVDHVRYILGSVENLTPTCIDHVTYKIGHNQISKNMHLPDKIQTAEGLGSFDQTSSVLRSSRAVIGSSARNVAESSLIYGQTCANSTVPSRDDSVKKTGFKASENLTSTPTSGPVTQGLEHHTAGVLKVNEHCRADSAKNVLLPDPILPSVHPNGPPSSNSAKDDRGSVHHHQSVKLLPLEGDKKLHKLDTTTVLPEGSEFSICPDIGDPVKSNGTNAQRENDILLIPIKPPIDNIGINEGKQKQLSFGTMTKTGDRQTEVLKAYMQRKKLEAKKLQEVEKKLAEEGKLRKQKNLERLEDKRKKLAQFSISKLADRLKSTSKRPLATDTFKKRPPRTCLQVASLARLKTVSPQNTSPQKAAPMSAFHTTPTKRHPPVTIKTNSVPIQAEDLVFTKSLRSYTPNKKHVSLSFIPKQKLESIPSVKPNVFMLEMPIESTKELYNIFHTDTTKNPLVLGRGDGFLATSSQKELNREPYRPRLESNGLSTNEYLRRDEEIRKLQSENQESGYSRIHSLAEEKVCVQVSSITVSKTVSKNVDGDSNFSVEIKKMEKVLHAFKQKFEQKQKFNLNRQVNPKDICDEKELFQANNDIEGVKDINHPFFCTDLCIQMGDSDKRNKDVTLNDYVQPSLSVQEKDVNTPESGRDIVDQNSEIKLLKIQETKNQNISSENIACKAATEKSSVINDINNILDAIKHSSSSLDVSADTGNTLPEDNISAKVSLLKRDLKSFSSIDCSFNTEKVKLKDQKKSEDSVLLDNVVNSNDYPQVSKDFCTSFSSNGIRSVVADQQVAKENPMTNISPRRKLETTLNTPSLVDLVAEEVELNNISNQECPENSILLDSVTVPNGYLQIPKEFRASESPNASKSSVIDQQVAQGNFISKLSQIDKRENNTKLLTSVDGSLTAKIAGSNIVSNKERPEGGALLDKTKIPDNYSRFPASCSSNELKNGLVDQEAVQQKVIISHSLINKEQSATDNKLDEDSDSCSSCIEEEDEKETEQKRKIIAHDKTLSTVRKDSLLSNDESTKLSIGTTISEGPLESIIQNYTNTFLDVQPIYSNKDDSYSSDFDENTSRGLSSLSLSTISQVDTERLPTSRSTSPDLAPSSIKSGSCSRKTIVVSSPVKDISSGSGRTRNQSRRSSTANRNRNNISCGESDFNTINGSRELKKTSLKLPSQEDVSRVGDPAISSQSNHDFTYLKNKDLPDRAENDESSLINKGNENFAINNERSCFSVNSFGTKHINGADDVCGFVPNQPQINYVAVQNYSPLVIGRSRLYSDNNQKSSNVLQDIATQMPSRRNSSTNVAVQANIQEDCKLNFAVKQILDASQRVEKAARGLFLLPDFQSSCTSLPSVTDASVASSETELFATKLEKLLDQLPLEHGQLIREEIRQHLLLLQYEWSTKKNLAKDELKSIKMDMARVRNNSESMSELQSRRKSILIELQNEKDNLKRQHCKVIERIRQLVVNQLSKKRNSDLDVFTRKSQSLRSHNSTLESNKPNDSVLSDSTENESRLIALSEMFKKQKVNLEKLKGERIELDGDIVKSREEAKLKQLKAVTEDLRQLECEIKVIAENPNSSLVKPIIGKPRLRNRSVSEDNKIVSGSFSESSEIQKSCNGTTAIGNSIEMTKHSTGSTSANKKDENVDYSLQNTNYDTADVVTLDAIKKTAFSSKSVSEVSDNIGTSEESERKSLHIINSSFSESVKLNVDIPVEAATTVELFPDYQEEQLDSNETNVVSSSYSSELKHKRLLNSGQELSNIMSICRPQPIGAEAASNPVIVSSKAFSCAEEREEDKLSNSISTPIPVSHDTLLDENTSFDKALSPDDEEGGKDRLPNLEIKSNSSCIPEMYFQRDLKSPVSSSIPTIESLQSTLTSESDESCEKEMNGSSIVCDLETSQLVPKLEYGDALGDEQSLSDSFQTNVNSQGNIGGGVVDSIEYHDNKESFGIPDEERFLFSESLHTDLVKLEPGKDLKSFWSNKLKCELVNALEIENKTMYQTPESSCPEITSHLTSYESKFTSDSVGDTSKCSNDFSVSTLETSQADKRFKDASSILKPLAGTLGNVSVVCSIEERLNSDKFDTVRTSDPSMGNEHIPDEFLTDSLDLNALPIPSDVSIDTNSSETQGLRNSKSSSPIPEIYFMPDEHFLETQETDMNFNDEESSESYGLHDTGSKVTLKNCSSRTTSPKQDTHLESFHIDSQNDEKELTSNCKAFTLSLNKSNGDGKSNQGSGTSKNEVYAEDLDFKYNKDKDSEVNTSEISDYKESELKGYFMCNETYEIVAEHDVQKIKNDFFSTDERIKESRRSSDYEQPSQKKLENDILPDLEGPAQNLITSYSKDPAYVCREISSNSSNARNPEEAESLECNKISERGKDTVKFEEINYPVPKHEQHFIQPETSANTYTIPDYLLQENTLTEPIKKLEEQEKKQVEKSEVFEFQQIENIGTSTDIWDSSSKAVLLTESIQNKEERRHKLEDQVSKPVELEQEPVENLETWSSKQHQDDLDESKQRDEPEELQDEQEDKVCACSDTFMIYNSFGSDISQKAVSEKREEQEREEEAEKLSMLENEQVETKQAFTDTFVIHDSPVRDTTKKKYLEKFDEQRKELEEEEEGKFKILEDAQIEKTQTFSNTFIYDSSFGGVLQKFLSEEQELDEEVKKLNKLEDEQAEKLDTSSDTFIINDSSSKEISPTESPNKQEIVSLVSHVLASDDSTVARIVNDRMSAAYFTTSYDVATTGGSSEGSPDHGEYNPQKEEVQFLDSKELISKLSKLENLNRDFDFESQWMDDDLLQSPIASAEEEAVAIQKRQHKIDLEIQQLQGLSETTSPTVPIEATDNSSPSSVYRLNGFFYREIPNKPPPPYTPPLKATNLTFSCTSEIIPSSLEDVQSFVKMYCARMMENNVSENTGIEILQCLFEINDEFLTEDELISRNSYAEFLCHLVDEAIYDIRNPSEYHPKYSYYKYLLTDNSAMLKEAERVVFSELGLVQKCEKESRAVRWSLKTRDKVDEILVRELQSEGDEWNDLSHALRKVQNQLAEDLLSELLVEVVAEMNDSATSSSKSVYV
ncbi:uncharacterized protein LOC136030986 isoform X2 [Artemia franciscana]|uniref:Centrosome-associated protein 350 n=1 Tax=Artemia franciscana TaxID=6661 RepID=A0AA88KSE5_ARTSF|nr:hypothetical protein QYM36_016823 [Artemia franciscana]